MLRGVLPLLALSGSAAWAQAVPPFGPASGPAPPPAVAQPQAAGSAAASVPFAPASGPGPMAPPVAAAPVPAPVAPPAPPPVVAPPPPVMPQPGPQAAARTPAPPAPPTPPVKGLPPDAPKLVVNGAVYSERRDMRMAIVNGNVVREGAEVEGVTVESIQPQGLVLAFRGTRYHVTY